MIFRTQDFCQTIFSTEYIGILLDHLVGAPEHQFLKGQAYTPGVVA